MDKITQVGPHRLKVGSVSEGLADLMGSDMADVFYSDPPWGEGLVKMFETMNLKSTGAAKEGLSLDSFNKHFFEAIRRYARNLVAIEYGFKFEKEVPMWAAAYGLNHAATLPCFYDGKKMRPMHLHVFYLHEPIEVPATLAAEIQATQGSAMVLAFLRHFGRPGQVVLDPCAGLGATTARASCQAGMVFRGNELNAARAARAVAQLRQGSGAQKSPA
jgi:hypothetical protein